MNIKQFLIPFVLFVSFSCYNPALNKAGSDVIVTPQILKDATVAFEVDSVSDEDETLTTPICAGVFLDKRTLLTAAHCPQTILKTQQVDAIIAETHNEDAEFRKFLFSFVDNPSDLTGIEMDYSVEREMTGILTAPVSRHKAKVIAFDLKHDLALLQAEEIDMPVHSWLKVQNGFPAVGDKVYIVGHPGNLNFTFLDGLVSAIQPAMPTPFEGPFLQVFSGISHGNSGGPICNARGEIIGIVSFIVPQVKGQGFATPGARITQFLEKSKIQLKP